MSQEGMASKERLLNDYNDHYGDVELSRHRNQRSPWSRRFAYVAYLLVAILLPMNALLVSQNYKTQDLRYLGASRFCEHMRFHLGLFTNVMSSWGRIRRVPEV